MAANQLTQIVCALPGVIFECHISASGSASFTYLSVNYQQLFGASPEPPTDHYTAWQHRLHPDDRVQVLATFTEDLPLQTTEVRRLLYRARHPEHGWIWVDMQATPEHRPDDSVVWRGLMLVVDQHDPRVQIRLAAESTDAPQTHDMHPTRLAFAELTRLEQRSHRHNAILTAIVTGTPMEQILTAIVDSVEQESPTARCSILLVSEDGRFLQCGAAPSLPDFYSRLVTGTPINEHCGSCGAAVLHKQRVIIENIHAHPEYSQVCDVAIRTGIGACWSEPVFASNGRVLAVLCLYHDHPIAPDARALESMHTAASLTSLALERVYTEQNLQHRHGLEEIIRHIATRFLEVSMDEVDASLHWALGYLGEFMQADRCYLFQFSKDGQRMSNTHEWCAEGVAPQIQDLQNLNPDDFEWSIQRTRRFQWYTISRSQTGHLGHLERKLFEEGDIQSLIGIPIHHGQSLQGFLGLDDIHTERHWPEVDCRFLQIAAAIIGVTLERHRLDTLLQYEVNHDVLTGTFNRRWLQHLLDHTIQQALRYEQNFSLILLDIDHFKLVNDHYGHDTGDQVLSSLAQVIQERVRASDVLARWGGEEFILLLPKTPLAEATRIAESLRQRIESTAFTGPQDLTISQGITGYQPGDTINSLVKRADQALYLAKQQGRNCWRTH